MTMVGSAGTLTAVIAARLNMTGPEDPLLLPVYTFSEAINVNVVSAYAAAREAVAAFKDLPLSSKPPPTFILTGNITNTQAFPAFSTLALARALPAPVSLSRSSFSISLCCCEGKRGSVGDSAVGSASIGALFVSFIVSPTLRLPPSMHDPQTTKKRSMR